MRVVKKIFGWIFDIILFIILGIALIMAYNHIQINIKGNTYTTMLGYSAFEVSTGSMAGTIEIGDAVLVKLIDQNEIVNKDEIIVYSQDTALITHRIVEVNGNEIITKGDANNTNDTPIQRSQVVGKVIKVIPEFRMWKEIILTPKVLIPASVALLLLWVFFSYDKVKVEVVVKEKPSKISKKHIKQEEPEKQEEDNEEVEQENSENVEEIKKKTTKEKTTTGRTANKKTTTKKQVKKEETKEKSKTPKSQKNNKQKKTTTAKTSKKKDEQQ